MKKLKTLVTLLFFCATLTSLPLAQIKQKNETQSLVLEHISVIDVAKGTIKSNATVIITGDRIAAIGKNSKVKIPKNAQAIDATGKFLIPGLWDMHVHLSYYGEPSLLMLIANGITGVRDMGCNPEQIDNWRKEIANGSRTGPRIIMCGPFVDGQKKMDAFRTSITSIVTTEAEARGIVRSLKQRGVDFIKVHSRILPVAYFAVADEARKQKMTFAGHLPPGVSATKASDAGVKSIEHIESLMEDVMYLDRTERDKRFQGTLDELAGTRGATVFKRFVKNGTWIVPTLFTKFKVGGIGFESKFNPVIKALNQAGVGLLAGTDFAFKDGGISPGDLHEELDLLVKGGLTPIQALQTATINPARFLNILKDYGTVERGKIADLVLLEANPFEDIRNTQKINAVIVRGKLITTSELQTIITNKQP